MCVAQAGLELVILLLLPPSANPTGVPWRDSSVVKSIAYSSKCPEFNSQQPHGDSQLSNEMVTS